MATTHEELEGDTSLTTRIYETVNRSASLFIALLGLVMIAFSLVWNVLDPGVAPPLLFLYGAATTLLGLGGYAVVVAMR